MGSPRERVKELRELSGLNRNQAAALAGMSGAYLGKVETGEVPLTRNTAEKLALAFKTSIDDILPVEVLSPSGEPVPIVPAPEAGIPVIEPEEEIPELTDEERAAAVERVKAMLGGGNLPTEDDTQEEAQPPPALPYVEKQDPVVEDSEEEDEPVPPPMLVTQESRPPEDTPDTDDDEEEFEPFEQPSDVVVNPASGLERSNNHLIERVIDKMAPSPLRKVVCQGVIDSAGTAWEGISVGPQDGVLVKVAPEEALTEFTEYPELMVRHDMNVSRFAFKSGDSYYVHVFVNGYPATLKKGVPFALAIPGRA